MATDITPTSEVFTTTSMKPAVDEAATAQWAQKLAANTGFLLDRIIFGTHTDTAVAGANTWTINFNGSGLTTKVNGRDSFGDTNYFGLSVISGNTTEDVVPATSKTTTTMDASFTAVGGSVTLHWVAIGYVA